MFTLTAEFYFILCVFLITSTFIMSMNLEQNKAIFKIKEEEMWWKSTRSTGSDETHG